VRISVFLNCNGNEDIEVNKYYRNDGTEFYTLDIDDLSFFCSENDLMKIYNAIGNLVKKEEVLDERIRKV